MDIQQTDKESLATYAIGSKGKLTGPSLTMMPPPLGFFLRD